MRCAAHDKTCARSVEAKRAEDSLYLTHLSSREVNGLREALDQLPHDRLHGLGPRSREKYFAQKDRERRYAFFPPVELSTRFREPSQQDSPDRTDRLWVDDDLWTLARSALPRIPIPH